MIILHFSYSSMFIDTRVLLHFKVKDPNTSVTLTFGSFLLQCLATRCACVCPLVHFKPQRAVSLSARDFFQQGQVSFEWCASILPDWTLQLCPLEFLFKNPLETKKRTPCDSCVLVIVVYPVVRNCRRENLSLLVLDWIINKFLF